MASAARKLCGGHWPAGAKLNAETVNLTMTDHPTRRPLLAKMLHDADDFARHEAALYSLSEVEALSRLIAIFKIILKFKQTEETEHVQS